MKVFEVDDYKADILLAMLEYAKHMYGIHGPDAAVYTAMVKVEAKLKAQLGSKPVKIRVKLIETEDRYVKMPGFNTLQWKPF